jgi:hypothetical protein
MSMINPFSLKLMIETCINQEKSMNSIEQSSDWKRKIYVSGISKSNSFGGLFGK